jgi:hypothetical protein
MSVEALKSTSITNLDATPVTANTAGRGAVPRNHANRVRHGVGVGERTSTYRMIRVPRPVKIKSLVRVRGDGGRQRSTSPSTTATAPPTVHRSLPGPDRADDRGSVLRQRRRSRGGAEQRARDEPERQLSTQPSATLPLWQALGLTTDPGGFFDIVYVVHTTAITTGAARLGLRVEYVS